MPVAMNPPSGTRAATSEARRTVVALILASVISGLVWGLIVALHVT